MSQLPVAEETCPRCGNWIAARAAGCPICGWRDLPSKTPTVGTEYYLTRTSIVLMITILLICGALMLAAPGIGFLFLVLGLAPTVRTFLAVRTRMQRSIPTTTSAYILMYVSSVGFTAALIVTCVFVSAVTFFLCLFLECLASSNGQRNAYWLTNSWIWVTSLVGLSVITLSFVLIRARWRWDTTPPVSSENKHDQYRR